MFWHTSRKLEDRLYELERTVADLRVELAKCEPAEIMRLRQTVNNSIRSLNRLKAAENVEEGEGGPKDTPETSTIPKPWWAHRNGGSR